MCVCVCLWAGALAATARPLDPTARPRPSDAPPAAPRPSCLPPQDIIMRAATDKAASLQEVQAAKAAAASRSWGGTDDEYTELNEEAFWFATQVSMRPFLMPAPARPAGSIRRCALLSGSSSLAQRSTRPRSLTRRPPAPFHMLAEQGPLPGRPVAGLPGAALLPALAAVAQPPEREDHSLGVRGPAGGALLRAAGGLGVLSFGQSGRPWVSWFPDQAGRAADPTRLHVTHHPSSGRRTATTTLR